MPPLPRAAFDGRWYVRLADARDLVVDRHSYTDVYWLAVARPPGAHQPSIAMAVAVAPGVVVARLRAKLVALGRGPLRAWIEADDVEGCWEVVRADHDAIARWSALCDALCDARVHSQARGRAARGRAS